ncbi:uncharacterized protein LOC110113162 [Dendrobium catenatum]|uniref:uncharacterized protein LOC110113162 n=1 Tax=Dendrobium catenatum TaxID=906689 RepID=UPI0009F1AE83|nr:uncharacterized protein LOC110113162 [Dendrobium catenatum]
MIDEAVSPLASGGASASAASAEAEDVSTLLPLSLRRSQLIPPAPNRRRSAIDFLHDFGGSSWIAYGASSLLVISHFPSPLPEHENLVGPFFRQVIEPSSCSAVNWAAYVNAVSWCPVRPSEGEVAAAQGNSIWLYAPQPDSDTGSFCWSQTAGVIHSSIVEAIEWTGSGDGLIAAGMEVVFWRRKGSSWEMSWKSAADVPQAMVSATWSAEGPVATAACWLTSVEIGAQNLPELANVDCRLVSVYHSDGKSEAIKIQLCHPQPVSLIRWRPSTLMKLTKDALCSWKDVLLTCCLDGTVRLWSEIDNGKSRKVSKEIDHKIRQPFQVVAVIEIEQCLNGTLGTTIFIDWAVDMASVISKSEGDCHSLSSASSKHDQIASCEWLISVGPVNLVALWAVHCLDDATTFRSPRVTLWWKKNPADLRAFNFSNYRCLRPAEKPVLVKVVAMRRQLFGPPFACSLLQLLPDNCMTWWHLYNPSIDDAEHSSLTQVRKERCLSHFTAGVLNIDGHSANILQLALHTCSHELELAVSLDSNGFLLFWSFSKHFNCTLGMQMYIHPTWKLMGKIRSQDLSTNLQYLTVGWAPFVLDEKPLLLLGYTDGIDCFLINVPGEGEDILCHKIFSVSFASHNHLEGSPDLIFATPLAYFPKSFLLCGVWMKALRTLSWKIVLQSEDLTGSSCEFSSDSETVLMPGNMSKWISHSGRRYSATICPASWNFPHPQNSKTMICVSVVTLDHSIISNVNNVISNNVSYGNIISLMAIGFSDGVLELWKVSSAKSLESESIPWVLVGKFAAHDGPVNAVSLSSCGSKIATVNVGGKNCVTTLHVWTPICLIGGGSFILEDVLLFNGPVIALKWSVIGNGNLLLGVCMPNEFYIYCERRSHSFFVESDKSKELHPWCCISMSHSCQPCHEFQWGPMLTPVLLHERKISIFSEWLSEAEYNHIGESSSIYTVSTDENSRCGISLKNNVHGANELSQLDNKENGIAFNVVSSGSFLKKEKCDTRNRLHSLMDMVERLCRPLDSYHPWALLQYLYSGNWKRAYIVLKHLVDSLSPLDASTTVIERCSSEKPCHIPQISLSSYLDGTSPEEPGSNTVQWGEGSNFVSATFEKNVFQFGKDTLKTTIYNDIPVINGLKSEIMGFIDTLEKFPTLAALTNMERIHILTVLDILLELSNTSYASLYDSLDEPGRRFWVAVRFQHFQFLRKVGRVAAREEFAIESWLVAWACQSDCQENLLNSILSTEPSWLEMRNLGLGYWLTNASQLRARMEKLARLQYLKRKNPKDCALLYLALNRLHVLAGLFRISKDEKDKILFGFLSRNFQQLISRILLPNAIDKKDYWLSSVFEWSSGNYSESVKRLFEPSVHCSNGVAARKCFHVSFADPHVGRYCLILASKPCLKNAIGDYLASVLSKFSTVMDSYSLKRFGLPLEALERLASQTMEGNSEVNTKHIEAIFEGQLFPFSIATATQAWLQEGFAYHLESNFRLSLAMIFISNLLRELPCWAYRNPVIFLDLVKNDDSDSDQEKHKTGEFRQKLNVVILTFERRYSLKLIDLANMVLLLACNNGLLFLGYQLLEGFIFRENDVDNQHKTGHSTRCTILFKLIVKANKELFYAYSRYVVCCHLSDSTMKLLSGRASSAEICSESYFQRNFCMQCLICSLRIIKPLVKYYDNLLLSEGLALSTYSFLELVEYMLYFSRNWFNRNISGLIQMVCQIHSAFVSNHDSIEVLTGEQLKILHPTSDNNTGDALNDDEEVLHEFINQKNQAKLRNSLAFSIPEDERWQLIGTSLWIHNNSFTNQKLSKFLATQKLEAEKSIADHNQFRIAVAKLTMASIAYVSSSVTKQLASFLREKASKGLPVATFAWLEESKQHESSSLPHQSDQGICIRQLSASEDREDLAKKLWEISINAKEIYQNLLNEKVYGFTYSREKLHSSWKDFQEVNLSEHVSDASHYKSEGNSSARNAVGSLFGKKNLDTDTFLETRRRDSDPKLEKANFCNPTEIVKRSGELLEAICCNSIYEQQLAATSNRKGLFFFNWKMEPARKEKSLLIWPEADWPLDGWAGSESKPGPTCVSPGVGLGSKSGTHLGLGGATVGLDSMARPVRDLTGGGAFGIPGYAGIGASGLGWGEQIEFEILDPPAVAEHVCSRALSSHPSRPFLLVGSINTLIHLWEFGKDRALATYGVLPAVNVPPSVSALEFDHGGQRFASAALDGTVCTWQLEVGGRSNVHPTESSFCFNNNASDVAYVAASGSILAAAGCSTNGHNVVLWDTLAPPGTSQASLLCHEGGARSLSVFDNDVGTGSISPLIVTGGKNGDVGLHDFRYIATGRSKRHRQPRDQDLKSATFVNTSNQVDNANGMIWYIPKAHLGSITRITTIPNTSMFLTGSKDGDVKLWDAKRAQLVFHWQRIHDRHTFIQPNSRTIGGVIRAAVTDIQVFSCGFLTCGGDGSVKLVQLK